MTIVRVAPSKVGRLVRVYLESIPIHDRQMVARRLREKRWADELRPDVGYSPTMTQRLAALGEAVELERAATYPSDRGYLIPDEAVSAVMEKIASRR